MTMREHRTESSGPEHDEFRATAALAFAAADGIVGIAAGMQRAITRRSTGPFPALAAAPLAIAAVAYAGVRTGFSVGAGAVDAALDVSGLGRRHRPLRGSTWGRRAASVLNGAVGDRLAARYPALSIPLRLRADGQDLPVDTRALAERYPDAGGHLVMFVHGLIEDEDWWRRSDGDGLPARDFGRQLADDIGITPLYVRYNTGRHISDNARELADLLTALVAAWPVEVRRISLVGHSMGGLVARGAVHHAVAETQPWLAPLREVVCLGSPHRGSHLARGAGLPGRALRLFPESAPLAVLFTYHSSGIKDLSYGYLDEAEWVDQDPEALRRPTARPDYRTAARQRFLAATLARDPDGPAGRLIGDLLVTPASAVDEDQPADRRALGGLGHFDLLTHPRVYQQVRDWLAG